MSQRSPSATKQLLAAGLVGVGVGVLAAGIGIALSNKSSPTNQLSVPSERRCRSENSSDRKGSPRNVKPEGSPRNAKPEGSPRNVKHKGSPRNVEVEVPGESGRCKICGIDISSEPSVPLPCNHSFHRKCLFSSYIVQTQVNRGRTFRCPFDACQAAIPENILESLMSFH